MPADRPALGPDPTALFRYEVIASLLHMERGRGKLRRALEKLAARTWDDPRRGRVRIAKSTIEDWLYAYEKDGLQALELRARKDRGRSRKIQGPLADRVEELARRDPPLTGVGIQAELEADDAFADDELPALSTVYRFLRAKGIDLRRPPQARDSRAYGFDLAGDCWQTDVMYGPHLPTAAGHRRRTYLFAVLDDATRVVAHAQFYFEQHSSSLKDTLKQAFLKRGLPRRLYTDQGRIFRSRALAQLAARLAIQLIHGRPYQPQGRAKVERFFGTIRRSFLSRVFAPCGLRWNAFTPGYGMAESAVVTRTPPGRGPLIAEFDAEALTEGRVLPEEPGTPGTRRLVSCGPNPHDQRLRVVDPERCEPCPPGRVGELWIASPSLAAGYLSQPEASASRFGALLPGDETRYLRTGDLGFLLSGELFLVGRLQGTGPASHTSGL